MNCVNIKNISSWLVPLVYSNVALTTYFPINIPRHVNPLKTAWDYPNVFKGTTKGIKLTKVGNRV